LNGWSTLEYLPELSMIQEKPAFSFVYNMATHEEGAIGPDYKMSAANIGYPEEDIEKYGSSYNASSVYTNIASFKKVTQWFEWMKENGVYDNTQILIVADHGRGDASVKSVEDGKIPYSAFQPLMLHKPYNTRGFLKTSSELMSNAYGKNSYCKCKSSMLITF